MKRNRNVLIVTALLLSAMLAGCQNNSPLKQTVIARESYTGTLNLLADAREHGYINDGLALKIEPYRKAAADALDAMERDALAGSSAFSADFDAFTIAMSSLENASKKGQ